MTTTSEPEFVAQTLVWCNERRAEKGQDPLERLPKGRRSDGESCPCGAATGLFVSAFDRGELPQYDEGVAT